MNKLIIRLLVHVYLLLVFLENLMDLISHLKIEIFELPHSDTGCCSRILFDLFDFCLSIFDFVVGFDVIVDGKDLSESFFIKHLMYSFGDHG